MPAPKGGLLYLVLTAHEPSVKPLANIVSCYICSDRQYKRKNTFHFSHLPSRINGRARPQTHYTTRFAKKIQEMPRAGLSYRGKALLCTTSQSASQTAPLVGEPLAKPFTLRGLPKPPLGRGGGSASALTERLSPAVAHGQALLRTTSQSASQTAPLVGEPLAKPFTLRGLPKPPLGRSNGDDRRQWRKQGGAVGAAASRMRAAAKQTLGAATRAVAARQR